MTEHDLILKGWDLWDRRNLHPLTEARRAVKRLKASDRADFKRAIMEQYRR